MYAMHFVRKLAQLFSIQMEENANKLASKYLSFYVTYLSPSYKLLNTCISIFSLFTFFKGNVCAGIYLR